MTFRLNTWCNAAGHLDSSATGAEALGSLKWILSGFETPEPIAISLEGVAGISDEFIDSFFRALADEWPESYFGRHPIVVVNSDSRLAAELRDRLHRRGLAIPVAGRSST